MKNYIILAALTSIFSFASVQAGGFSWGISFGIGGGCTTVYAPPVVYAPVVYTQPVVVAQPVVQQVVYTAPAVVVQPVCTIPVVNYYRPDCYRSPVTGTVWVGGGHQGGGHRHHGRR